MSASWPSFEPSDTPATDADATSAADAQWLWQSLEQADDVAHSAGGWTDEKENLTRESNVLGTSPSPSSSPASVKVEAGRGSANTSVSVSVSALLATDKPTAEEQRRRRHNANERRRTNALKTRILLMREELAALEVQRDRLRAAAAGGSSSAVSASTHNEGADADAPEAFLDTVRTIDQLRVEQQQLQLQLRSFDMQNSTYQTILTEFGATPESRRLASTSAGRRRRLGHSSFDEAPDCAEDEEGGSEGGASDESGAGEIYSEHAPIFQRVLLPRPMPLAGVMACVKQFYEEIMRFRAEREFESLSSEIFGWRDRRVLDATSLRFMLSQHFEFVPAEELVYKTWGLLTTLALYRRIQPRTVALKLLQRVTDDCVIVRVSVSGDGAKVHSSILLVARGRIDGGFLITYRSIPLTPAQRAFADGEGDYVHLNNWYMFLDGVSARGAPACEVTLGGTVANQPAEYLRYLMMEVVAAVVRWQTAVGHSRFWLTC